MSRAYRALVFDTETTALVSNSVLPEKHQPEITEYFGQIVQIPSMEVVDQLEFFCKPRQPVSEEVTRITGITNDMLMNEKPFSAYSSLVARQVSSVDAVVAHNLSYDVHVVTTEFSRINQQSSLIWPRRKICTVESTEWLKGYRLNLSALHEELFGEKFAGAHRARQDVEALTRCFCELVNRGIL